MSMLETKIDPKWKFNIDDDGDAECWKCNQTTKHHYWIYDTKTVSIAISKCKECGLETKEEICPDCWEAVELTDYDIGHTGGLCWRCFGERVNANPELYV